MEIGKKYEKHNLSISTKLEYLCGGRLPIKSKHRINFFYLLNLCYNNYYSLTKWLISCFLNLFLMFNEMINVEMMISRIITFYPM